MACRWARLRRRAPGKGGWYIAGGKYQERFGNKPIYDYCYERIRDYCRAFRVVDCANPANRANRPDMPTIKTYRKLPVRQGFVPCAELFENSCELRLRMLEGDMDVHVDENSILMIGIMGEVCLMELATFEKNYRALEDPYTPDLLYAPTALNKNTGKRISLLEHAHACISTDTDTVKALCLDEHIKVFTCWDAKNYVSGKPGDWLVARSEEDWRIVTASVFAQTYALDMTGENISCRQDAQRAAKRNIPVHTAFAAGAGVLQTDEGMVSYEKGDAILTGVDGESWPVSRHLFDKRHVPAPGVISGQDGAYTPLGDPVWVLRIHAPFIVTLSEGKGSLRGKAGDWLVQHAPGEYGIVDGAIFEKSYRIFESISS